MVDKKNPKCLRKTTWPRLTTGTSVAITGEWKESLGGKRQERELLAQEVKILGGADPEVNPPIFSPVKIYPKYSLKTNELMSIWL